MKEIKVRPFFVKCIVIESITIALVLVAVLIIKFTNKPLFSKIDKWYEKYILDETKISEITERQIKYEI